MRKYTLYAVGEIALVVIGILIALSINNWNEERKDIQVENRIFREFKKDIESDILFMNSQIDRSNWIRGALFKLKEMPEYSDSVKLWFNIANRGSTIVLNKAAFETLKSIGVNQVRNDSIRREILELYKFYDFYMDIITRIKINNFENEWRPFFVNHFYREIASKEDYFEKWIPLNYESLINDPRYKNMLIGKMISFDQRNSTLLKMINKSTFVLKMIDEYLN